MLVIGRLLSRRVIQRLRVAGHFNEKVLLVGTPATSPRSTPCSPARHGSATR